MREKFSSNLESQENNRGIDAEIIRIYPGITAEFFDSMTENEKAVVLIAYATGTVPGILAPVIQQRTKEGIPIFLVSNNPGDEHGIRSTIYAAQEVVEDAGAIPIRKVNVNNLQEVLDFIKETSAQGLMGSDLGQAVYDHFDYKDGEKPPLSEWEL